MKTTIKKLTKISFMQFLEAKFSENYIGLDDDMYDGFEAWLAKLDVQDLVEFAEEWGSELESR